MARTSYQPRDRLRRMHRALEQFRVGGPEKQDHAMTFVEEAWHLPENIFPDPRFVPPAGVTNADGLKEHLIDQIRRLDWCRDFLNRYKHPNLTKLPPVEASAVPTSTGMEIVPKVTARLVDADEDPAAVMAQIYRGFDQFMSSHGL